METDTNRHRHERDAGLIESIIEPMVRDKDLFCISKHSQTQDAPGNGEHEGVFQLDFNEPPLYILMMCKCGSDNTESLNIGYTITYTNNDKHLGVQRSHSAPLKSSLHINFSSHVQQKQQIVSFQPDLYMMNVQNE